MVKDYNPLFSVIIPAYNADKFLDHAIQSILKQSFINWELVIVENGSCDHTCSVAQSYLNDHRVHLFHSEKGVSKARNYGIQHSKGQYILFLDADDELCQNTLESFANLLNSDSDYYRGKYFGSKKYSNRIESFEHEDIIPFISFSLNDPTTKCTIACSLFKRSLLERTNILFDEDIKYAEDSLFLIRYLLKCDTITIIDLPVYKYNYSENSTVRNNSKPVFEEYKKSYMKMKEILSVHNDKLTEQISSYILNQVLIVFVNNIFCDGKQFRIQKKEALDILNDQSVKEACEKVCFDYCDTKRKAIFILMRNHFITLIGCMCKIKAYMNGRKKTVL